MNKILNGMSIAALLAFRFSSFFFTMSMATRLASDDFILLDYVLVVSGVFCILGLLNISNGAIVEISEYREQFLFLEKKLYLLAAISLVILSPALLIVFHNKFTSSPELVLCILLCIMQGFYTLIISLNKYLFRHKYIVCGHIIMSCVLIISSFYVNSLIAALQVLVTSYSLVNIMQAPHIFLRNSEGFKFLESFKRILVLSFSTFPMTLSPVLTLYLDRVLIVARLSEDIAKNYIVDIRVAIMFSSLFALLNTFVSPYYYKVGEQAFSNVRKVYFLIITTFWLIGLCATQFFFNFTNVFKDINVGLDFYIVGFSLLFLQLAALYGSPILKRNHKFIFAVYILGIIIFYLVYEFIFYIEFLIAPSLGFLVLGVFIFLCHFGHHLITRSKA